MHRIAFTMQLHPGFEEEYRRRHAAIWPELAALLHDSGVREYSIFLDTHTAALFAYLQVENPEMLDEFPRHPVMRRWWDYMKDIMDTHPDFSPVTVPLQELFYLP